MIYIYITIIILLLFYFINIYLVKKENFCYGNVYCNGNKDSSLCINQGCLSCGLQASCKNDNDCTPNNCINGCCDNR